MIPNELKPQPDDRAFPNPGYNTGMSIRTWLAGNAITAAAVMAADSLPIDRDVKFKPDQVAEFAVKIADSIIVELNKEVAA